MPLRISIITHYFKSKNYGGLLQSYALQNFFDNFDGAEAKQITYDLSKLSANLSENTKKGIIHTLAKRPLSETIYILTYRAHAKFNKK